MAKPSRASCVDCAGEVEEEDGMQMGYVGEQRGDYIQELSYKFVGDGKGEFEVIAPPPPKPKSNHICCLCMVISLLIFGIAVYVNVMTHHRPSFQKPSLAPQVPTHAERVAAANASNVGAVGSDASLANLPAPPKASCDPTPVHAGDLVQAAFDIAFRPAGLVREGSRGSVGRTMPSPSRHQVVVNWQDYPQLQGSKVSRTQLMRVLSPGDAVTADVDIVVERTTDAAGSLNIDDLVLATKDIKGRVPRGTYGYVISVLGNQKTYLINFPEFPQFDDVVLNKTDVTKAPIVGDEVSALAAIDLGAAGVADIGANGTIVEMSREGTTYRYAVHWKGLKVRKGENHLQESSPTRVSGLDLKLLQESSRPAPIHVNKGTWGQVVSVSHGGNLVDGELGITFDGLMHTTTLNVSRDQVKGMPHWSASERDFCCRAKHIGCAVDAEAAAATEPA